MQNPRLASRYAKSLLDLAVEQNGLDATLKDMQLLRSIFRSSRELEVMLGSPVISGDKKLNVMNAVLKEYKVNALTTSFITLLISKGREATLSQIVTSFVEQYNTLKNIRTVRLTTAAPLTDGLKSSISTKIAGYMPTDTIEMRTSVDESLIGGFVLEIGDRLFDASVKKSLQDLKSKVVDHTYESKI
ncbi:MAG: ATP synthase F1 subunit delta [Bacteroidota bacterium]